MAEKVIHQEELAKEVAGLLRELVARQPHCGPAYVLSSRLHMPDVGAVRNRGAERDGALLAYR